MLNITGYEVEKKIIKPQVFSYVPSAFKRILLHMNVIISSEKDFLKTTLIIQVSNLLLNSKLQISSILKNPETNLG